MNTFVIKLKTNKKNKTYTDLFLDRNTCHTYSFHYFSTVHNVQLNFKQLVNFLLLCWRWSHESNPVVLEQRHWKLLLWHLKLFFFFFPSWQSYVHVTLQIALSVIHCFAQWFCCMLHLHIVVMVESYTSNPCKKAFSVLLLSVYL